MPATEKIIGKLGKHPAKADERTLKLADYIDVKNLPEFPKAHSWIEKKKTRWGRMKNFTLNDCTCAAAGHLIQCWTLNTGKQHILSDKEIVKMYSAVTGYDPKTGANDKGAKALDVLKHWRKTGVAGNTMAAFASVSHQDKKHIAGAIYLFGGVYAGLQLPKSIKGQKVWDVPDYGLVATGAPGSYGGHAVVVVEYDDKGLTCISWGRKTKMTWAFWDAYAEEAFAIISNDFMIDGKSPVGFDVVALADDLMKITRQKVRLSEQLGETVLGNGGKKS